MSDKIYLIDGSGYIFRAYYAVLQPLKTKNGFPTNALFGFTKMLLKLLKEMESDQVVMIFDAGKETFRNQLYPLYKANRSECPEDLVPQMPYFREISKALGLRTLEMPGFEADDLIGTFVNQFQKCNQETVVVSADKDLMQLVHPLTSIYDPMKGKHYQKAEVIEKFGVAPEQVVDFLALTGDSSDNIPGLSGVGPKTATALIQAYGNIEQIIESADLLATNTSIRGSKKIAEQIKNDPQVLRLSKSLTQIELNVPLILTDLPAQPLIQELNPEDLKSYIKRQIINIDELKKLTEQLEFDSLVAEFLKNNSPKKEAIADYQTIYAKDFPTWLKQLESQKEFSFDLETTSLNTLEAEIVGAAFCWDNNKSFYLPIAHRESSEPQIPVELLISSLKSILENPNIKKIGQNLKYDVGVLANYQVRVVGISFDTMVAAYLIDADASSFGLTRLAKDYLGYDVTEYTDTTAGLASFAEVEVSVATHYAAQDAHYAWLLKEQLAPKIIENDLSRVMDDIEMPLIGVLSDIERNGIGLDTEFLLKMSKELEIDLEALNIKIQDLAGEDFNQNSTKQLATILFDKLNLPTAGLKKTKTGISTDVTTLEKLSYLHPLPKTILDYRELYKLKSTYVDALPRYVNAKTNRLHTSFNQTITATGRLSSSSPNLQNIPIQSEYGRKIREAFCAPKGKKLISADYSQIELRVLADLSQDQNLINAFKNDQDIHTQTARQILNLPADLPLDSNQRRLGKTINFGIIYGMSGFRLARELEIPVGQATRYIDDYFSYYSGVREYFKNVEAMLNADGYVETMFGRKRYIKSIDTAGRDKGFLVRAALNAPVQGTAADIIKIAMNRLQHVIIADKLPLKIILQVHDELLFETSEDFQEQARQLIQDLMESALSLAVPLKIGLGIGSNWGEIH